MTKKLPYLRLMLQVDSLYKEVSTEAEIRAQCTLVEALIEACGWTVAEFTLATLMRAVGENQKKEIFSKMN